MVTVTNPDLTAKAKRHLPPPALKIWNIHLALDSTAADANRARYERRENEKPEIQALYVQLQAENDSPKPDSKRMKELESGIAEIKNRWAAEDAEHEARAKDVMNNATPSAMGILEPYVRLDLKSRQTAFNYFEELPEGKTPRDMVDECREAHKPLLAERSRIVKASQSVDETKAAIAAEVAAVGQKTLLNVGRTRFLDFNIDKNRFEQRPFKLPTLAVLDGVGATLRIPDALGLMALLWPAEITDRLTALAFNGDRSDANTMTRAEREAAFDDVEAKLLANARRGEFWIRQCQARNIAGGPRFTEDPRAILDLA